MALPALFALLSHEIISSIPVILFLHNPLVETGFTLIFPINIKHVAFFLQKCSNEYEIINIL